MWRFEEDSRERVADVGLANKLHNATVMSVEKTEALAAEVLDWQTLRGHARQIKLHTLTHLDRYLRQFVEQAEAGGAVVSWADSGEEACVQIVELARRHGVTRVSKAKSMTGEEIEINRALTAAGIEPVETDFGEMICQLAGEMPSHVTAPIIHWSAEEVAQLLKAEGVIDEIPAGLAAPDSGEGRPRGRSDATPEDGVGSGGSVDTRSGSERIAATAVFVAAARRFLRAKFMSADMGISGANLAVAQSGTLVLVENEANIRLTTTLPGLHVAIVGIDKLIPKLDDLGTFLSLLPVAATGQRQSAYVSLIHRPYGRLHIVLLDNGRGKILADKQQHDLLSCIRCGACLNVCPVYRHVSGHGYHSVYPGPIGAVLMPHLRSDDEFKQLPFASSLCGACTEICPVGIPLHERLLQWRQRIVRQGGRPRSESAAFAAWDWLMRHPALYRATRPPGGWLDAVAGLAGPGRAWKAMRELPEFADETFTDWWRKHRDTAED